MGKESGQSPPDSIIQTYQSNIKSYKSLIEETIFILSDIEEISGIKLHTIEQRIKSEESARKKIEEKGFTSIDDIVDLAAVRIVCLFRNDLKNIKQFLEENFNIIYEDEKIEEAKTPFAYLSNHYVCKLPNTYAGPRYARLVNLKIEIQVRTLCMHSWASVSHYLDYKVDSPLPPKMKLELLAIAGLFFVADHEFERFYLNQQKDGAPLEKGNLPPTKEKPKISPQQLINLLKHRFPKRKSAPYDKMLGLLRELEAAGYENVEDVGKDIDKGEPAMKRYETEKIAQRSLSGTFADIGATRVSLRIANPTMRRQSSMPHLYDSYVRYIRQ